MPTQENRLQRAVLCAILNVMAVIRLTERQLNNIVLLLARGVVEIINCME